MIIEAMKLSLEAIQDLRGYRPDIDKAIDAIRTTIQQAEAQQPDTGEPVAVTSWKELERLQAGIGSIASIFPADTAGFHVQLYTRPAPSVPDDVVRDAERWRHAIADGENQSMNFLDIFDDWDGDGDFVEVFDAAMLAAK